MATMPSQQNGTSMQLLLLITLLANLSVTTQAPQPEESEKVRPPSATKPMVLPLARGLMTRYVNAMGGRIALWDLESFHAEATLSFSGGLVEGQLDLAFRRPNLMRIELDLDTLGTNVVGSDGRSAWEIVSIEQLQEAELIPLADAQRRRRAMNWFELALRLTDGARTFRTVAPAEFDGHPCWEIQKITRDGNEERIFIDRQKHLLRGIRMIEQGEFQEHEITLSFRDWKPVKPLILFHEIVISRDDLDLVIRFDKIGLNKVSPDRFQPPAEIEKLLRAIPTDSPAAKPEGDQPGNDAP